jgi:DoxX-like family
MPHLRMELHHVPPRCIERVRTICLAPVDLDGASALRPRHPVSCDGRRHEDGRAADRFRDRDADRMDRRSRLWQAMGLLLLAITVLYAWPRTAVLGAILLTGYLGGAVATHVRISNPILSHRLFGVYLGMALWGGLWLCDALLAELIRSIAHNHLKRTPPRRYLFAPARLAVLVVCSCLLAFVPRAQAVSTTLRPKSRCARRQRGCANFVESDRYIPIPTIAKAVRRTFR